MAATMLHPKKKIENNAVENAEIRSFVEVLNSETLSMRQEIIGMRQSIESLNDQNCERLMLEIQKISQEVKVLMKEKDDAEQFIAKSRREVEAEQQTLSFERAIFQNSIQWLQKQYEQSLEIIEKLQKESEILREKNNEWSETIRNMKEELDPLKMQVTTERMNRTEYEACISALRDRVREQEVALQISAKELIAVQEKKEGYELEADKAKCKMQDSLNELHAVKRLISVIGLSCSELEQVAAKLAGLPKVGMPEILDLLEVLCKSDRSWSELKKIISIMNMEQPWSADDLLRVRKILSGPPVTTLDSLNDMILGKSEHIKTELLSKRVSEMEELMKQKLLVETNVKERITKLELLSKENHHQSSKLQSQNQEIQTQLMQLDQINICIEQLKNQNENLKGETSDMQLRMGHLDAEFKRFQEDIRAKDSEIERLNSSKTAESLPSDCVREMDGLKRELAQLQKFAKDVKQGFYRFGPSATL